MEYSNKIKNLIAIPVSGGNDDTFIGLKIVGNQIKLFYPECYRLEQESLDFRDDIIDLLRTISIAKTPSSEKMQANNTFSDEGEFALMSYLWIIKDYLSNGFYLNREKIFKTNQKGRVNWKKTLQSQTIVSNGNIIYPNLTVEVRNNTDNILVEIHKHCIKISIDYIGWLFNLNSTFIQTKPYTKELKKLYISTLRGELDRTFDDDKRVRLNHLLKVIIGLDQFEENKEFVYGVNNYYFVFERMIDNIFGNVNDLRDFYPKANWYLKKNLYNGSPTADLRPDTLIIDEDKKTTFILDSKFYRFGYTGSELDLPETSSIQKQITYGEYVRNNAVKFPIEHVYNAFLMPYDKEREVFKSTDNIQYVGYAKSEWKANDQSHEFIHAFLIDLKHVVKTWNRLNHDEDVKVLIEEIEKHDKEIRSKGFFFFFFDEKNNL